MGRSHTCIHAFRTSQHMQAGPAAAPRCYQPDRVATGCTSSCFIYAQHFSSPSHPQVLALHKQASDSIFTREVAYVNYQICTFMSIAKRTAETFLARPHAALFVRTAALSGPFAGCIHAHLWFGQQCSNQAAAHHRRRDALTRSCKVDPGI
jgi:hypothetical protein